MKEFIKKHYKIIDYLKKILTFLNERRYLTYMLLPFILMDLFLRLNTINITFYPFFSTSPTLFTTSWLILFIGLSLGFKKKIGKKIYLIIAIIFLFIFFTNSVYYSMTNTFFDFNLLESASEGSPYIIDAISSAKPVIYLELVLIIYLIHLAYTHIPYRVKNRKVYIFSSIILFLVIHLVAPITLGKANEQLTWSSWRNPRNIYQSFNDANKSFKITGLYEYTIRDYYITFLKTEETENAEDEQFLTEAFADATSTTNKYTGIYAGKNLILVQLEGIDSWLLNEEDTPTLYRMLNNSINFANHYSYYNGGGSTFNSEFAVNTGFITPLSYTQNAYSFNKNKFPYSLANLFKVQNYRVNAFHMNTGEYYSRTTNYKNWGYDNYYGLLDINEYSDESYKLDRELILDETFNQLMFDGEGNFVNYIITYSNHIPFSQNKGVCKQLIDLENTKAEETEETIETAKNSNTEEAEEVTLTEEDCARIQAKETDYFMELLLKTLEEKELLDNTVIAVFTDHYLYTLEDKTILDKYKETSNNLINHTPFFIWTNDSKQININKVTSQLNILPTILNLFGIEYNPNNYIGEDALSDDYSGIVFFSDYSWYDGNVYVEGGLVTNNKSITSDHLEELNYYINYLTKKNDLALKYNIFKKLEK